MMLRSLPRGRRGKSGIVSYLTRVLQSRLTRVLQLRKTRVKYDTVSDFPLLALGRSQIDVLELIKKSPSKQCLSDPCPTWILKKSVGTILQLWETRKGVCFSLILASYLASTCKHFPW